MPTFPAQHAQDRYLNSYNVQSRSTSSITLILFSTSNQLIAVSNRRSRRMLKSPDPLEEQRRKELQGGIGTGGVFGQGKSDQWPQYINGHGRGERHALNGSYNILCQDGHFFSFFSRHLPMIWLGDLYFFSLLSTRIVAG